MALPTPMWHLEFLQNLVTLVSQQWKKGLVGLTWKWHISLQFYFTKRELSHYFAERDDKCLAVCPGRRKWLLVDSWQSLSWLATLASTISPYIKHIHIFLKGKTPKCHSIVASNSKTRISRRCLDPSVRSRYSSGRSSSLWTKKQVTCAPSVHAVYKHGQDNHNKKSQSCPWSIAIMEFFWGGTMETPNPKKEMC